MNKIIDYIRKTLGLEIEPRVIDPHHLSEMPFFLRMGFELYECRIFGKEVILIQPKSIRDFIESSDAFQLTQQFEQYFTFPLILVLDGVTAGIRKRLVKQSINFIVPGKQLYLPALLIDFNESFFKPIPRSESLTPSAQLILLYHYVDHDRPLEQMSFKEIAETLGYSQMGITKAVDVLKQLDLCEVTGSREKNIHFKLSRHELWVKAEPLMINPVQQVVYVSDVPPQVPYLMSNLSALPLYTNLNEIGKQHIAMERSIFYGLTKSQQLPDLNDYSGNFYLEVWKYDPLRLTGEISTGIVDPLSLYLSLRENPDERVQIELEQLIKNQPWYMD